MLPQGLVATVDRATWELPAIFKLVAELGNVPLADLERTLNLGVGMVAIVSADAADAAVARLNDRGLPSWIMGTVTPPKKVAHGHVIQVFGRPNFRTVINCLPPADWDEDGYMGPGMIYTAMPATNAIPYVVAADPGIVTLKDLPVITGRSY